MSKCFSRVVSEKIVNVRQSWHRFCESCESARDAFVQTLADVIYERYAGERPLWPLKATLTAFSWGYKGAIKLRNLCYDKRLLRDNPLGCAVIVVGNLTVGGTGKTPIVELLARELTERGRKVAILSRGYKSRAHPLYKRAWYWITHKEAEPPKIVSNGKDVFLSSLEAGDEPYMLARNLPGVVVLVDKNRVKAGHFAVERFGCDTLILDDGFQYRTLRGRVNCLLIDQTNPFGNGKLLPRGILREPIRSLRRASYIFMTKCADEWPEALVKRIRQYKGDVKLIACTHKPRYLQSFWDEQRFDLSLLHGVKVGVLSGIAVPESFESELKKLGAQLVYTARFLDHHRFSEAELKDAFKAAVQAGAQWMITTEKDAVRLPADLSYPLDVYYVRMEIEMLRGQGFVEELLGSLAKHPRSCEAIDGRERL